LCVALKSLRGKGENAEKRSGRRGEGVRRQMANRR
jgi:hypothetical protein